MRKLKPDSWVFSTELPSAQTVGHSIYDPSKSSTSRLKANHTWGIVYADKSAASGIVYTDTVEAGGTVVTDQAVELARRLSAGFLQNREGDGIMGLAFSTGNRGEEIPDPTMDMRAGKRSLTFDSLPGQAKDLF